MKRNVRLMLILLACIAVLLVGVASLTASSSGDADHPWLVLGLIGAASLLAGLLIPLRRKAFRAVATGLAAFAMLAAASDGWIGDDWSAKFIASTLWTFGPLLSLLLSAVIFLGSWLFAKWMARP